MRCAEEGRHIRLSNQSPRKLQWCPTGVQYAYMPPGHDPNSSEGGTYYHWQKDREPHNYCTHRLIEIQFTYTAVTHIRVVAVFPLPWDSYIGFSYTNYTKRRNCKPQEIRTRNFDESPHFRLPESEEHNFGIVSVCL
ncbi:hypothetical protein AVEN_147613-1 [Araneus ventricosus]|uniref:Uncharacterized protein n=1 Tax=Araneus ventricosus TaxID=182803 RepID=A0A4Y2H6V1_ARAVE|nr:hypothetical protein AVEN_147613-1 [Araneus ventricosus]